MKRFVAGLLVLGAGCTITAQAWAQSIGCAALASNQTNYTPAMYDGKALTYYCATLANATPVNTVLPAITGTATVGNALSSSTGTWTDADGDPLSYSYQWYRADDNSGTNLAAIAGATTDSRTLTASDAHKYLRAVVTANDGRGGTQTATSAYTEIQNSPPRNVAAPTISGSATVGNVLTTSFGGWTEVDGDQLDFSYQWYRADDNSGTNLAAIAGATSYNHTLTTSDARKYLRAAVTVSDGRGGTQTANSAYVQVVNSAPTDIALNNMLVNQSSGFNATVGVLTSTDADVGNTFTYTLVAGGDSTHNSSFNISGSSLRANNAASLASGSYSVRIRTTDNDGGFFEKAFTVTVVDDIAPTIAISSSSANLKAGETATVTFTLSEASSGNLFSPSDITVSGGTLSGFAGSGTSYTATFTPSANLTGTAMINVGANTFTDAAGNGNTVATPFFISVDTAAPAVSSVSVPASGYYIAGQTMTFTVNTSRVVTVDTTGGTPHIALTIGSNTRYATYVGGTGTAALTFSYTIQAGDNDSDGISVGALGLNGGTARDAAGNDMVLTLNSVGSTSGVLVDTTAPTLLSLSPADNSLTVSPDANFVMTFSENIHLSSGNIVIYDTLNTSVVTINVASHGGQLSVNNNQLTINPAIDLHEGTRYYIQVANSAIRDMAGIAYAGIANNSTWNFTVADLSPPVVTSIVVSGTPAANATAIQFTVTFNEPPQNVSIDDFTLTTTSGNASGDIASVAIAGNRVTVAVDSISGTGALRLDLKANTDITDGRGNGNNTNGYVPAFTAGASHTVDRDAPAAPPLPVLYTGSDSGSSNSDGITNITAPTITGTAEANATVRITSSLDGLLGLTIADGSGNWSFTTGILSEGVHSVTVTATDAAGNQSAVSPALNLQIDTTPPTVTVVMADTALLAGKTSLVTFTFSEAVVGFNNDDLTIANGTLSTVSSTDNGRTWTATFTPSANTIASTNAISLALSGVTDIAGNTGVGTENSANYTIDTLRTAEAHSVPGLDTLSLILLSALAGLLGLGRFRKSRQ